MTSVAEKPGPVRASSGYRWWIVGSAASITGDAALNVALSWQATAFGERAAATVLALPGLVGAALLLFTGVATDRFSARRVLVWSSAVFALTAAVMTALTSTYRTELAWLAAFAVVIGVRTAVYSPASVALTRQLVTADELGRALSLRQVITQVAGIVGRPLGGALVALGGLATAAGALVVAYLVALGTVLRTRVDEEPADPPRGRRGKAAALFEGLVVVGRTRVLRELVLVTGAAAGVLLPVATLLVPLWVRAHGHTALELGWIVGLMAAATIGVASWVSWRGPARRLGLVAGAGLAVVAAGALGFVSGSTVVAGGAAVLVGAGQGLFSTHAAPLVKEVPREHTGKVQSVLTLAQTLAASAGTVVLGGVVARTGVGIAAMLWCGLLAVVAASALGLRTFRGARSR